MKASTFGRRALWFVGLPGSGKSTVARLVYQLLLAMGVDAVLLEMDARRKEYFPAPDYTREEREKAYAMFVDEAASLVERGACVVMDGTACKRSMRRYARERIKNFIEIHVACSLQTAMEREASRPEGKVRAELYRQALERRRTGREFPGLGEVIGVDVPFEANPLAELVLDSEITLPEDCAAAVMDYLVEQHTLYRSTGKTS